MTSMTLIKINLKRVDTTNETHDFKHYFKYFQAAQTVSL